MKDFWKLPLPVRVYLSAYLCATVAVAAWVAVAGGGDLTLSLPLGGLLALSVLLHAAKVEITRSLLLAKVNPGTVAVYLAQLALGTPAAMLCDAAGGAVGSYANRRRGKDTERRAPVPAYRVVFNICACVLPAGLAGLLHQAVLDRIVLPNGQTTVLALAAWSTVYFLMNSASVAAVVGLSSGRPIFALWRENFLWAGPEFFSSAAIALGVRLVADRYGLWSLLLAAFIYPLIAAYKKREAAVARDQALEASRYKTEFLATMSHEIRTPLNGVVGMAELLVDRDLDSESREMARVLHESASSLLTIVNDVLDFSKIEAGEMRLETTDLDLAAVLRGAAATVSPAASRKGLPVQVIVDERLPASLRGDPARLRQVLLNFLSNAVKFTPAGAVTARADVEEEGGAHVSVRLSVTDTGIGLTEEARQRLFRPYAQAEVSTAREYGGTGLGLSVCRRLVELMGGTIGVESQPGCGSTFWFRLRMERSSEVATTATASPEAAVTNGSRRSGRILLADDHPINRTVILRQLEQLGYQAEAVTGGREAVAAVTAGRHDLVLMDCRMADMDGIAATRAIRACEDGERRVPILALSANVMPEDRQQCLAAGMDETLTKPITLRELGEALERWLPADETGPAPDTAQAPEAQASSAAIRLDHLQALLGGNRDAIGGFLRVFVSTTRSEVEQIWAALCGRDAAALRATAHGLKGSAGVSGADELALLAARMELAAASSDWTNAETLFPQLQAAFGRLEAFAASIAG